MVTLSHGSTSEPANPPYPLTEEERRQKKHEESSEDEWEKDDLDEDEDWELTDKPKPNMAPDLPDSLRAGPKPSSSSYAPPQLNHQVSQISLTHQAINPLESQISLPTSSVYSSQTSLPRHNNGPHFLRPQNTGEQLFGSPHSTPPVPITKDAIYVDDTLPAPPTAAFSNMNLTSAQRQELQPPLIPVETELERPLPQQRLPSLTEQQTQEQILMNAFQQPEASPPEFAPPPGPPPTQATQQRAQAPEYYSIKQARWYDAAANKLRTSPILTQSDNGPCPLLALVNALVMSTPVNQTSSLIETMRSREQVSLSLLIEAIISHMAEHRDGSTPFPDLDQLNKFLRGLHTGMNVNPRFIPNPTSTEAIESYAGGFESTPEMKLYSLFNVPLVHGWLPSRFDESPAHDAFERSAPTYEDAQNIQFGEDELEHKLSSQNGLSQKEQELFEDLHTIKGFLDAYQTQLTPYGLDVLHKTIAPAQFAILFRNDHFSTIYMEPRSKQLMTLVTDAGYASHEEIIWESLADVSGRDSEMFSGDFRPVSHTLNNTRQSNNRTTTSGPPAGPRGSSLPSGGQNIQSMLHIDDHEQEHVSQTEQEDHDLALAMQLQEEEEASARRQTEARQRDNILEPQTSRVNIPVHGPGPRRSSATQAQNNNNSRPAVPPRRTGREEEDVPPPSYEQAASRPAYNPPAGHPASTGAPLDQYGRPSLGYGAGVGRGTGRGGSIAVEGGRPGRERDRDCIIM